jgi:hypothetical protein
MDDAIKDHHGPCSETAEITYGDHGSQAMIALRFLTSRVSEKVYLC